MTKSILATKIFNTKKSVTKADRVNKNKKVWVIHSEDKIYTCSNNMERVGVIRKGIPYESIDIIS